MPTLRTFCNILIRLALLYHESEVNVGSILVVFSTTALYWTTETFPVHPFEIATDVLHDDVIVP